MTVSGNSTFRNNTAQYGGVTHAHYSTLTLTGNSCFTGSSAIISGGAFMVWYSKMHLVGDITFGKNSAEIGGGIHAGESILNFTGDNMFTNNTAKHDHGGGIHVGKYTLNLSGNSTFRNKTTKHGKGIRAEVSIQNFTMQLQFFHRQLSHISRWSIIAYESTQLHFAGDITLGKNSAEHYGGGIYAQGSTLNFIRASPRVSIL